MYKYEEKQLDNEWWVVTKKEGIKIAKVPSWMKHPKTVASAIAESLNASKLRLVDLV